MKIDLHNHTHWLQSFFSPNWVEKDTEIGRLVFAHAIKAHGLDGLAITNREDITYAQALAREYPQQILVGCEYEVTGSEGKNVYIVALGITEVVHKCLMEAKWRGVAYFTAKLQENNLAYFLAHLGWGLDPRQTASVSLLEKWLQHFYAVEVLTSTQSAGHGLATDLSRYYGLAGVGGTDSPDPEPVKRAYTVSAEASNFAQFLEALRRQKVQSQISCRSGFAKEGIPSLWSLGSDFYQRELARFWRRDLPLSEESNIFSLLRELGHALLAPTLQLLPRASAIQRLRKQEKNTQQLERLFANYLKKKETQRIFSAELPLEEKKELWLTAMHKIYHSFSIDHR